MTVDELREHARLATTPGPDGPSDVPATEVLAFLDSDDRNVRVAALRVLAWSEDTDAAIRGILRMLDDPKKRVREVAAKSLVRYATDGRVVARLLRAIEDDEPSAWAALEVLSGAGSGHAGLFGTAPAAKAIEALADHPRFRQRALSSLLRARTLTDDTTALLRRFVKDGSKDEAVAATRRLDGFRIFHDAELTDEQRARAERAHGRVWYWVRDDAD